MPPLALDLLAAPASEAYVLHRDNFPLCRDLTAAKRIRMQQSLEHSVFEAE